MNEDEYAGARDNAKGWYETIKELVERLYSVDAQDDQEAEENRDKVRREIEEGPLSVLVRDGWRKPGASSEDNAEEFEILLTTGGPALRIYGRLNNFNEPDDAELQMQDWDAPWGKWVPEPYDENYRDTLLEYARCFYFGE